MEEKICLIKAGINDEKQNSTLLEERKLTSAHNVMQTCDVYNYEKFFHCKSYNNYIIFITIKHLLNI